MNVLGALLILAGYVFLVFEYGWTGVAITVASLVIMLGALWLAEKMRGG